MTDSVNKDAQIALFFDFYIDTPSVQNHVVETNQVAVSGRTWEITTSALNPVCKPQLFFAAKSGKLFNRVAG